MHSLFLFACLSLSLLIWPLLLLLRACFVVCALPPDLHCTALHGCGCGWMIIKYCCHEAHFRINVHTNAIGDQSDKTILILTVNDEDVVMKAPNPQECAKWVEVLQQLIMKLRREDKKNGDRMGMKARHDAIRAKYGLNKQENLNSKK